MPSSLQSRCEHFSAGHLAALIQEIEDGRQDALAILYHRTRRRVYAQILRILNDQAEAEEVTSDVYFQVWRRAASYDPSRGRTMPWLLMLARSRALDRLRSGKRRQQVEEATKGSLDGVADTTDPERDSLLSEQRRQVRAALRKLSPEQRRLIESGYFRGLSHREMAAEMGMPLGTIKTRIRLGKLKLRRYLSPLCET
ncbi:MAG: sigma-70 family RNA polymerase sigma factor [Acidobacteriota bacterium]